MEIFNYPGCRMDKLATFLIVLIAGVSISNSNAIELNQTRKNEIIREMEARILHMPEEEIISIDGTTYIRQSLNDRAGLKGREFPAGNQVPIMQVFSGRTLTIKKLVLLLGAASDYQELFISDKADVEFLISINEMENDLGTIAQYISDKSPVEVSIYPETHVIQIWPSRKPKYQHDYE